MKKTATVLFGLFVSLMLNLSVQGQAMPGAHLTVIGTNIVSVGQIPCYQIKQASFRLVNTSDAPVSIRHLRPTCTCISGESDKTTVSPGEELTVTLSLDPKDIVGPFQRGVWVMTTSNRQQQNLQLILEGESTPPFIGQPTARIAFQTPTLGIAWTNRYSLRATEKGLRFGRPVFQTATNLDVAFSLSPNPSEADAYHATLVVKPLALGCYSALISLPVEGITNMPPVLFNVLVRAGLRLSSVPDKLLLARTDAPVVRRLLIHTAETAVNRKELSWEPHIEGLEVSTRDTASGDNVLVELRFSPEAAQRVLAESAPKLTFHYTNYESVAVQVLPLENMPEDKARQSETRPSVTARHRLPSPPRPRRSRL